MIEDALPDLILGAAILVCAIGLHVASRVMKRHPDTIYEIVIIAFALAMMIMVPSFARSLVVGGFCVTVMIGVGGLWFTLTLLGLVAATAFWLPGGVSALLLGILAIVGISQIRAKRRHLVRLSRAHTLVANEEVFDEVELTGKIRAVVPTVDPVFGEPCAMWKLAGAGSESQGLVEIRGATGSAIIDPKSVRLEWSQPGKGLDRDQTVRVAEKLGISVPTEEDGTFSLYTLPEDTECYVVGKPTWEMSPAATVGLYRDAPILPTFRSTPDRPAWFADRSEAQLRGDYRWAIVSWVVWGAMCGAIAVAQISGWA
jgi:hypothetical protein